MEDQEHPDEQEGEELEASIMQADHAFGSESVGTTAEEELAGETLDQRLAEERPDRPSTDEVVEIVDDGGSDDEDELIGDDIRKFRGARRFFVHAVSVWPASKGNSLP